MGTESSRLKHNDPILLKINDGKTAVVFSLVLSAATASCATGNPADIYAYGGISSPFTIGEEMRKSSEMKSAITSSDQLMEIRQSSCMTVQQLADVFGVSRQAMYARIHGAKLNETAQRELDMFYLNFIRLNVEEKTQLKRIINMALSDSTSLSSRILKGASGTSIEDAFSELKTAMKFLVKKRSTNSWPSTVDQQISAFIDMSNA